MERRSGRFAGSQTILLSWEEHSVAYRRLGNVADLEDAGLGILTDHSIRIGTPVTISRLSFLDFTLSGMVSQLSRHSGRYFIGVELTPSSDSARPRFESERLAA